MNSGTVSFFGEFADNRKTKKAIVFGTGYAGKMSMYILKYIYDVDVVCAFDNSHSNDGKVFWGDIRCTMPTLKDTDIPVLVCIFNPSIAQKVRIQCEQLGYNTIHIVTEDDIALETSSWDERKCIELMYYCRTGEQLNIDSPVTYNEKLQWLKLNVQDPAQRDLTDKAVVKDYVKKLIGDKHVIPTLGIWNSFDEIDFDKLPDRFVLKCTHDSGSVMIIDDKDKMDISGMREQFSAALKREYYYTAREPNYISIPGRIIAEPLLTDDRSDYLKDYKVFMFDGQPRIIQVDYDRFRNHSRIMYSADWKNLGFSTLYPYDASKEEPRPKELDEMLSLASKLSAGMPHVRVDFYIANDTIYFGELTFFHGGGYERFSDEKWNITMGQWLKLPIDR